MPRAMTPGWLLELDELMSAWLGAVGERDASKCPHRAYVPRKPEPLGCEIVCIADVISGTYKLNTKAKASENVHLLVSCACGRRRSRTRHRVSLPVDRHTQWVPVSVPINREAQ